MNFSDTGEISASYSDVKEYLQNIFASPFLPKLKKLKCHKGPALRDV